MTKSNQRTAAQKQLNTYVLSHFSRNELRRYASSKGIKRGNTKQDLINNLVNSDSAEIEINATLV